MGSVALMDPANGPNNNSFNPQFHSVWNEIYSPMEKRRVTRLILETYEVAFHLCSMYSESYGISKITDIVNQVLPTAYIMNTGYWVFYSGHTGQSICICSRYAITCPHAKTNQHWINMSFVPESSETQLSTPETGKVLPYDCNVYVFPLNQDGLKGYNFFVYLNFLNPVPNVDHKTIIIENKFLIHPEFYNLTSQLIQFNPHPVSHPLYATLFNRINLMIDSYTEQSQMPFLHSIFPATAPKINIIHNTFGHIPQPSGDESGATSVNFSVSNEVKSMFVSLYNQFQPNWTGQGNFSICPAMPQQMVQPPALLPPPSYHSVVPQPMSSNVVDPRYQGPYHKNPHFRRSHSNNFNERATPANHMTRRRAIKPKLSKEKSPPAMAHNKMPALSRAADVPSTSRGFERPSNLQPTRNSNFYNKPSGAHFPALPKKKDLFGLRLENENDGVSSGITADVISIHSSETNDFLNDITAVIQEDMGRDLKNSMGYFGKDEDLKILVAPESVLPEFFSPSSNLNF